MLLMYSIAALISGTLSTVFAFFVYSRNKKGLQNKLYALLSLSVAIWTFSYWLWLNLSGNDYATALFWSRMLNFGATLIPIFYVHWIFSILQLHKEKRKFIFFGYLTTAIFILFSFSPWYIKEVRQVLFFPFWPQAGIIYTLYIIINYFFYNIIAFYYLVKHFKIRDGFKRNQIKYLILGSLFGLAGGAFNFPLMYSVDVIHPIGMFFVPFNTILFAYASIKYRLMNIRVILTRSILYAVLVGGVASFFAVSIFVASTFFGLTSGSHKILIYIVDAILIVIFLDPIKTSFARITDKIFYKDKIDYQVLLQEAGNIIAREIDLEILAEKLSSLLAHRLKIKHINVFDSHFKKLAFFGHGFIKIDDNLADFLSVQTDIIITEELIRDIDNEKYDYDSKELNKIVDKLQVLNIEMVVPVLDDSKLIALLLLSDKQSGDLYNEEDINFFQVLVPQIASAFEKSQLYEEVQKFNVKLKKEVHQKTRSLQEANEALEGRNKFLTTMQVVTNMISRTLDLKQVMQMIADSISVELGYVGGILSFVDEDKKTLRVKAFTNTGETKVIWSTLPDNLKSYKAELKIGNNLGVDTVLNGRINYSDDLSDFLCPPADEEMIGIIQEALKIKTVVGVPIYAEDRVIGLIHFLLPFSKDDVSPLDEETMTAMTNQVGILSRNLALYDNLHSTNKELQEANVHLRALDKAKSEFVSIASHQLRTPISAIKGYLSMLIEGDFGELSDSVKDVTKGLFESSSRLARLVNTFLNVSRIESGRLKLDIKPVQVNDLIVGVIKELGNEAEQKGLKLTYEEDTDLPKAFADSDKLREVILNLIDNSIKYTPKGWVRVSVSTDDEKFTFQVKDTGIGIDPIEAKGLFRKFVRGSGVAQIHTGGSGLGLFIAQRIIKEHHGKIWAESKGVGKGSAFKFEVPVAK